MNINDALFMMRWVNGTKAQQLNGTTANPGIIFFKPLRLCASAPLRLCALVPLITPRFPEQYIPPRFPEIPEIGINRMAVE